MAFVEVTKQAPMRNFSASAVTVSVTDHKGQTNRVMFRLGEMVLGALGWKPGDRVKVQVGTGRDYGLAMLSKSLAGPKLTATSGGAATVCVPVSYLPPVYQPASHASIETEYEVKGEVVLVCLPPFVTHSGERALSEVS